MPTKQAPSPVRERITLAAQELAGLQTKVGYFESNKYPDGTPVAYVAAIQEFGYAEGGIPPRPFFRPTIIRESNNWRALVAAGVRGIPTGKRTARQVMEALGSQAAGDTRKTISEITTPPLKQSTLDARQSRGNSSTKPLVDTRVLLPTLTHVVETGGDE